MSATPLDGPARTQSEAQQLVELASVERWFLRAGVFLLPLGFVDYTFDQYVLPKLLIARVILLGLLFLFIARSVLSGKVMVKRTPLDLPLLALLASAVVSTFLAENQNVAIFGTYSRYDGLLTLCTYAGLFWLSVQTISNADDARSLLRVLVASGYLVAVVAILQAAGDSMRPGAATPYAYGTMGNPNVLGAFLAMVFALALDELVVARETGTRVLVLNVLIVVGLALLMSFSRSGWLGAALGIAIVAAGARRAVLRRSTALVVGGLVGAVLVLALVTRQGRRDGFELGRELVDRGLTLFNPHSWGGSRLHIWQDSLGLIVSRPVTGYGPDNFGLVFPRFETGDWGLTNAGDHQQIDKAHAETLQVAATQGLLGLAAYTWLLVVVLRSFWSGRRSPGAVGVFGAIAAYQAAIQVNFTALASAFPFWIVVAAGMVIYGAVKPSRVVVLPWPRALLAASPVVAVALVALAVPMVVYPYLADIHLRQAIDAGSGGDLPGARAAADVATSLAPQESVYSVEAANIALGLHDLDTARRAYLEAIRLGTYNPIVYINLALVDIQLGQRSEALWAARKALELNRFDPASQALLAQFEGPSP